ncbi:MAG: hypothetical protein KKF56_04060 [Nanoarchaeota archaeon]|nr:hypothetical protein [Nanoarchaeota archaeon]
MGKKSTEQIKISIPHRVVVVTKIGNTTSRHIDHDGRALGLDVSGTLNHIHPQADTLFITAEDQVHLIIPEGTFVWYLKRPVISTNSQQDQILKSKTYTQGLLYSRNPPIYRSREQVEQSLRIRDS